MAAPNQQPCGSRPGPKAPNQHAPHQSGKPAASAFGAPSGGPNPEAGRAFGDPDNDGVADSRVTAPVGNGKKNPLH